MVVFWYNMSPKFEQKEETVPQTAIQKMRNARNVWSASSKPNQCEDHKERVDHIVGLVTT